MVNQAEENANFEDKETENETQTFRRAIKACNALLKFVENSTNKIHMRRIQNQLLKQKLKAGRPNNNKGIF